MTENVITDWVSLSLEDDIEGEKCVVSQYRSTKEQRQIFKSHLKENNWTKIPIEWVIDIADESNGWFYGTAYHYDNETNLVHVMVPDKNNPTFDGHVLLDYRTVHLVECVDEKTDALFNRIIRDNIMKIKWEVEWYEEDTESVRGGGNDVPVSELTVESSSPSLPSPSSSHEVNGKWIPSIARYYIRISNQLLIEESVDPSSHVDGKPPGFVMLPADVNVKLFNCIKHKGYEDFHRLIKEGIVLCTPEAELLADSYVEQNSSREDSIESASNNEIKALQRIASLRKLTDMSHDLKDSIQDLVQERKKVSQEKFNYAQSFFSFTMNGDLDAGLKMMEEVDSVLRNNSNASINFEDNDDFSKAALETSFLVTKLEKGLVKLLRNTETEELETLRKTQAQMKNELDAKDYEIKLLKAKQ